VATEVITIQDRNVSANYQTFTVTGTPTNINPGLSTSYWIVPVSLNASGGTGTTGFSNNHNLFVALVSGAVGATGPTGPTGTSGPTVYPAVGIANSTGTAWNTSYSTTGTGTVVALATNPTLQATSSGLTLVDVTDNTKSANFVLSGLTTATNYTYALPALSGSTLAVLGLAQTWTAGQTFGVAVTMSSTTSNINIGTSASTGVLTLGGVSTTSILTVGRSTVSQTTNFQAGATASGSTKTLNIGTEGLSGSTTTISIGSAVAGATSTTTLNGTVSLGTGGAVVGTTATQTLTNKTITARVSSTTSIASPLAWNSDNFDEYAATAQAVALTINADAGTPTDGRKIIFRFTCDATIRVITFTGAVAGGFKPIGVKLTVSGSNFTYSLTASKTTYFGAIYNASSARWEITAIAQEA
jgi:hypothetical protein